MSCLISRLTDVVDPDILKYICLGYEEEEGLPLGVVELDRESKDISTLAEHSLEFCRYLHSFPLTADLCRSDCEKVIGKSLRESDPTPFWHHCKYGMVTFQVPILVGGSVVAVVTSYLGRMSGSDEKIPELEKIAKSPTGSDLDLSRLLSLADDTQPVDQSELDGILERLQRVSGLIQRIGRQRYETLLRRHEEDALEEIAETFSKPRKVGDTLAGRLAVIFERINTRTGSERSGLLVSDSGKSDVIIPAISGLEQRSLLSEVQALLDSDDGRIYCEGDDEQQAVLKGLQRILNIDSISRAFIQPLRFMDGAEGVFFWIRHRQEPNRIQDQSLLLRETSFLAELADRLKTSIDIYEADRRKDDFMAEMTHRLKAPMQSILAKSGFLNLYCQQKYPEDDRIPELCQEITREVNVLNDQTKNFTFITTMDKGEQEFRLTPYPIMGLLADCVSRFTEVARQREIEIVAKLDASPGNRIMIDRPKMEIAFTNLVDNAVKYSHSKKRIEIKGDFDWKANLCRISISSFGLGIAEHEYDLIFQRYYRARAMRDTRRYIPGTGIGLTVVREIIRGHGGNITVESRRGPGDTSLESREGEGYKTTFVIELPIK